MMRLRLQWAILSNRVVSLRLKIAWGLGGHSILSGPDCQCKVEMKLTLDHQQGEVVFQRQFAAEAVFRGEHGGEDLLC